MSPFLRRLIPPLAVGLARLMVFTLRFRLEDRGGVTKGKVPNPAIWLFWHNEIFIAPFAIGRFAPERTGAVLTSPSRDGDLLAGVMRQFGIRSIRGSSSRRGGTALRELATAIANGDNIAITPDGPRGPVHRLQPGAVKLAQMTGTPLLLTAYRYSRYWELKSWDRFRIPKPFSRVDVIFGETLTIPPGATDDAAFEAERQRVENALLALSGEPVSKV